MYIDLHMHTTSSEAEARGMHCIPGVTRRFRMRVSRCLCRDY